MAEIQELPENVPSGAQPSRANVLLEGDLVNKHLSCKESLQMRSSVRSEIKRNKKTPMFDINEMISSRHESVPFTEIKINDEEREQIEEIAASGELLTLMQKSILRQYSPMTSLLIKRF